MNKRTMKELIRATITATGLSRLHAKYRIMRGRNVQHLFLEERAEKFTMVYKLGLWKSGKPNGSLSGPGSEMENTTNIRKELPKLIAELEIKSLLDIGCGDWTWMQHLHLPCDYIGADIVGNIIEKNRIRFSGPNRKFIILDAVSDPIPDCDAILCREVLFHLSFLDALAMITNIRKSPARYLFVTNEYGTDFNADIITGDFRLLNLKKRPFFFPPPFIEILDDEVEKTRRLCIWRTKDIPINALEQAH